MTALGPRDVAKGMRHKFQDPNSPEYLENQAKSSGHGIYIAYGKRFCACCNQAKPKGKRKAVKGWRCDDCREAAAMGEQMK